MRPPCRRGTTKLASGGTAEHGIERYARKAARLLVGKHSALKGIETFGELSRPLVPSDARRRLDYLLAGHSSALREADFVPSLIDLAQVNINEETRYSLLLAAYLDPSRTGPVAHKLWRQLIALLKSCVTDGHHPDVTEALGVWSETHVDQLEVTPTRHASEWHNLDVFARVERGSGLVFGLVIENKVQSGTGEQDDQLLRYWRRIRDGFDDGLRRTVFLFLTEAQREMKTAGESQSWWLQLTWPDIANLLRYIGDDDSLPLSHRVLTAQFHDLITQQILGLPTASQQRERLRGLRQVLVGRGEEDPAWIRLHADITDVWSQLGRRIS